ncbi:MAG: sigma-70 family RNA polymerase sigma factor [Candidatus Omnitrophica bacterium]|nr:sigma-70 family RNA polymerase sigma factor [Candidatus Omnitrophota bacterium]MBU1928698.1 sigma-70 family RNA polymerase sigma factor [Candidatus Omnitrophota bacterium]MBU2035368.1 sigma-70 family RNA polymerase sigma factor [Candidatus Omnitrophota bacterium]MBU2258246.1 sigma-70 family RNA polymerase sigma factor [Candidatus Omnitrophota bacterium]
MNDLEFAHKCSSGDKRSWDQFVNKYSRLIYKYICSVFKSGGLTLDQDSISDTFQEIFLSLCKDDFKKLKSYQSKNGCSLASWLRQVAINAAIDFSRKLKPMVSIEQEDEEGLSLEDLLPGNLPIARDMIFSQEKMLQLVDCIHGLTKEDKYFLELYLNRGLSLIQIKRYFKSSRGLVDMRKSRIIDRLKDCFKSKGFKLDF